MSRISRLSLILEEIPQGYGTLSTPLMPMFQKDSFRWSLIAEESFYALKKTLQSTLLWALPTSRTHSSSKWMPPLELSMQEEHLIA